MKYKTKDFKVSMPVLLGTTIGLLDYLKYRHKPDCLVIRNYHIIAIT